MTKRDDSGAAFPWEIQLNNGHTEVWTCETHEATFIDGELWWDSGKNIGEATFASALEPNDKIDRMIVYSGPLRESSREALGITDEWLAARTQPGQGERGE